MRINADSFVGVGICILGLVGVGYAIGVHSKMKVMCDRLDTSIDNLANNTEIDIPAKVIDQAVQNAVERESYSAVKRATEEVAEKFDDKLDDLLEEFNGNLQNVGKIYKSIARSFSKEDI